MNANIVDAANAITSQLSAQRRAFHRCPEQGGIEFPNARPALVEKIAACLADYPGITQLVKSDVKPSGFEDATSLSGYCA